MSAAPPGDVDKLLESRLKRNPMGWMGDGCDTANAALFLASDEARFVPFRLCDRGTKLFQGCGPVAYCPTPRSAARSPALNGIWAFRFLIVEKHQGTLDARPVTDPEVTWP
tara:strand:- start:2504 stop:2836 length:333 start_codon:yes stop_codon:yes gene_type:complete